jgi:hypothetical protein
VGDDHEIFDIIKKDIRLNNIMEVLGRFTDINAALCPDLSRGNNRR